MKKSVKCQNKKRNPMNLTKQTLLPIFYATISAIFLTACGGDSKTEP
jgi:hypothetical protein